MVGETDIDKLMASLSPKLIDGNYVFCSVENACYGDFQDLEPLATFREAEGLTLVIQKSYADQYGLRCGSEFRCITLTVHSSLEAVGLTAAVSAKLAEHGISANFVAGYFHDHIFVQAERAEQALAAINALRR